MLQQTGFPQNIILIVKTVKLVVRTISKRARRIISEIMADYIKFWTSWKTYIRCITQRKLNKLSNSISLAADIRVCSKVSLKSHGIDDLSKLIQNTKESVSQTYK